MLISARDVPGIVAVTVLGADLAVLVFDDMLDLVGLGSFPACSFCFVLGAVAGTERVRSIFALVLPRTVFVVRLYITLSHRTLPLPIRTIDTLAARRRVEKSPAARVVKRGLPGNHSA